MNIITIISAAVFIGCCAFTSYRAKERPENYNNNKNVFKIIFCHNEGDPDILTTKIFHNKIYNIKRKAKDTSLNKLDKFPNFKKKDNS